MERGAGVLFTAEKTSIISAGGHAVKRSRHEDDLQRQVVNFLTATRPNCIWYAIPNGGLRSRIEASIMKGLGVVSGAPDLAFHWPGGSGFIELKSKQGVQSWNQFAWELRCDELRIPYRLCRTIDEVLETLKDWRLID
jgi:hypothetical protein